jgi:hypothetical protein
MTNENSSYIQSFPVNRTGRQTDNRRTLSEYKKAILGHNMP